MNARIYDFPTSAIMNGGKRINYYDFISSHLYKECDKALIRISKRINLDIINELIDSIVVLSDNHKHFLKSILKLRKGIIGNKSKTALLILIVICAFIAINMWANKNTE